MKLYRMRGSDIVQSLMRCSPLGRRKCHCIVARSPSRQNVSITLLCRHSHFGLLFRQSIPVSGIRLRGHPAESVLRIYKLLSANSDLSMLMIRLPSHSKKTGRSRPCHLSITGGVELRTSDVLASHHHPRLVVVKSFGSCPSGGSVARILTTVTPPPCPRTLGLCRLLTKGTGTKGRAFNSCGCRKR